MCPRDVALKIVPGDMALNVFQYCCLETCSRKGVPKENVVKTCSYIVFLEKCSCNIFPNMFMLMKLIPNM